MEENNLQKPNTSPKSSVSMMVILGVVLTLAGGLGLFGFYQSLGLNAQSERLKENIDLLVNVYNARVAFEEEVRTVEEYGNGYLSRSEYQAANDESEQRLQASFEALERLVGSNQSQSLTEVKAVIDEEDEVKGRVVTAVENEGFESARESLEAFDEVVEDADASFEGLFTVAREDSYANIGDLQGSLGAIMALVAALGAVTGGVILVFKR